MTADEARKAVAEIARLAGDDKRAHSAEDKLLWRFVAEVANGQRTELRAIAQEILRSREVKFGRFCA